MNIHLVLDLNPNCKNPSWFKDFPINITYTQKSVETLYLTIYI